MPDYLLAAPEGYESSSQAMIGLMAASFDDQFSRLEETVAGLEVEHLEWQERPGRSTIGMLMAHLAVAQIGGLCVGCAGLPQDDFRRVVHERLGIDTDGVAPMARTHPSSIKGRDLNGYLALLAGAKQATHEALKTWDDQTLDRTISDGGRTVSYRWILYHLLEHFASHFGQILSLLHSMRDLEVPGLPEKQGAGRYSGG